MPDNLESARRYLAALERGAPVAELVQFFAPEMVFEELPNRIVPDGARRELAAMLEASERGRQLMREQRYEILNAIASGDEVAVEVLWTGKLAVAFGSIPVGGEMRAHSAMFLKFRDGKIVHQRNYDCFEPW